MFYSANHVPPAPAVVQQPAASPCCPTRRRVVVAVAATMGATAAAYEMTTLGERTLDESSNPDKIRGWIIFGDVVAGVVGGVIGGALGAAADWAVTALAGRCRRPSQQNEDHS